MNMIVTFTESEEEQVLAAARSAGLAPADLIKRLTMDHLPHAAENDLDAKLRRWQQQDATPMMPNVSSQTLFADWAAEDANLTVEEREAEDRLWAEVENALAADHGVHFRQLGA